MTSRLPAAWVPPISRRQGGVFTARQALDAGATGAQVRRRRETGRWGTVVGDGLALKDHPITPWIKAQAVALTWPDAVIALATAAIVHGFPVRDDGAAHVILPRRLQHRDGLITHRLRLSPDEVARCGLARVTTRQRTLFDCLGRLPTAESESLLAWAVSRDVLSREDLERALRERPGWWGNASRRQALRDAADGALSAAERRLQQILRTAGIGGWRGDQRVYDQSGLIGRADVLFDEPRLVIEIDGYASHGRAQFQDDRTRQNRLVAAGFTVLRFTWADLTRRPDHVATQVRRTLALLSAR
jgi:very-short-patch-repair endonuclease